MSNKTFGEMISSLRREKNMTQNDLADKMNVTDKAVSKWERNLSCPDINSIPKLAEILGVSVEKLLNAQTKQENSKVEDIINIALIGVSLAMGICIVVTSVLKQIDINNAIIMLDEIKRLHMEEGENHFVAVIKGCTHRLRPILMTTLTTILALIPLSLGLGAGGKLMQPMAIVVIGGLFIGTFVTLLLIPTIYCSIKKVKQ